MSNNQATVTTESAPTARRVASIAHETIDKASGKAEEIERTLRVKAEKLSRKSGKSATDAKNQLEESLNRIEGFVKEKPLAAAGIAFAAGILGALILKK